MEGIPLKVSAVTRTTSTILLPRLAYSTKYIAAKIPKGVAINRASTTIIKVSSMAGNMETFSVLYSSSKSLRLKFGKPCHRI